MIILRVGTSPLPIFKEADMPFDARLLSGIAVLSAVVERGSFTGAGVALGMSASGVSFWIDPRGDCG
jgi:hypothetical protein